MNREIICIVCPRGCHIQVSGDGSMSGYMCKRGPEYVKTELVAPMRIVTSTVKTIFSDMPRIPVKTDKPIPKGMIMDCMREIDKVMIKKPMKIGDVVIENILDTGANIVLTRSSTRKERK